MSDVSTSELFYALIAMRPVQAKFASPLLVHT